MGERGRLGALGPPAADGVGAWIHDDKTGGAFRMEGDLEDAFAFGLDRIGRALAAD